MISVEVNFFITCWGTRLKAVLHIGHWKDKAAHQLIGGLAFKPRALQSASRCIMATGAARWGGVAVRVSPTILAGGWGDLNGCGIIINNTHRVG